MRIKRDPRMMCSWSYRRLVWMHAMEDLLDEVEKVILLEERQRALLDLTVYRFPQCRGQAEEVIAGTEDAEELYVAMLRISAVQSEAEARALLNGLRKTAEREV